MTNKSKKTPKRTAKQKSKSAAGSKPNVRISLTADPNAQLAYALQTDPSPLTVSVPGDNPVLGTLTFVMTNQQEGPVVVTSIGFTIELGDDGSALTASLGGIKTAISDDVNWTVTAPPEEGLTDNTATYNLGPQTGSSVTMQPGDSVWLQMNDIAMNDAFGVTSIAIKEMTQGNPSAFPQFDVTKFPYGFYFDGLVATISNGSSFIPVAEVGYNSPVTLLWNCSVTEVSAFQVLYATNQGQQVVTAISTLGRWDSPPLTRDTVFTVVVTTTVGGQPVSASISIPVAVQHPDVVANSLQVAGGTVLNGSVGISTSNPAATLNVDPQGAGGILIGNSSDGYTSLQLAISAESNGYSFLQSVYTAGNLFGNLLLNPSGGNVGVGPGQPRQALLAVNGGANQTISQYGYLNSSSPVGVHDGGKKQQSYSIWASNRIAAAEFNAFSDERIKNIEGASDSATDLQTLLGIEVTDYRYKDVVAKGNAQHKKVIAQQVEKVFPQAVSKHTDVVPDIYQQADFIDGWIALSTDLKKGERVRLISGKDDGVYEVLEVKPDKFRTSFKPQAGRLFVFGREVDDFGNVDYDGIAMLNVSATQQLKKEADEGMQATRVVCAELRAANEALLRRVESLESKMGSDARRRCKSRHLLRRKSQKAFPIGSAGRRPNSIQ